MAEQDFKGTVKEGQERRYTILNERDIKKYAFPFQIVELEEALNKVIKEVELGRELDGKKPYNNYIVINLDEPYIDEIIAVMKKHGHWEEE